MNNYIPSISLTRYREPNINLHNKLIIHLQSRLQRINKRKYKRVLGMVLDNVQSNQSLSYPRSRKREGKSIYSIKQYNKWNISPEMINVVVDWLEQEGYLIQHPGVRHRHSTIITKTDKFKYLDPAKRQYTEEYVVLKDANKNYESYTDSSYTEMARLVTSAYNQLLDQYVFELGDQTYYPQYTRIFNRDFQSGGRYYRADVLNIKSKDRLNLRINGEPVVEVDFKCFIVSFLLAQKGKNLDFDPYAFHPNRDYAKKVVNILFNSKDLEGAKKAVRAESSMLGQDYVENVSQTLSEALMTLCEVTHGLFSENGLKIMNQESEIATMIISIFTRKGLPILCIHDGFIVRESEKVLLLQCMLDSFIAVAGVGDYPLYNQPDCKVVISKSNEEDKELTLRSGYKHNLTDEMYTFAKEYGNSGERRYYQEQDYEMQVLQSSNE